jgi:hypothetical protein
MKSRSRRVKEEKSEEREEMVALWKEEVFEEQDEGQAKTLGGITGFYRSVPLLS